MTQSLSILNKGPSGPGKQSLSILNKGFGSIFSSEAEVAESPDTDPELWKTWKARIDDAKKREKDYQKSAEKIVDLFEGKDADKYQFNILYSNTETLSPALYNVTPRPVVKRRYDDADPIGLAVSQVLERTISFLQDPGDESQPTFDELLSAAVINALVPGRGVTKFSYEADFQSEPLGEELQDDENSEDTLRDRGDSASGPVAAGQLIPQVSSESVIGQQIPWNGILFGYAKTWKAVPWIVFEHHMTREELIDNFGEVIGREVKLVKNENSDSRDRPHDGYPDTALVYEVWNKRGKEVLFFSEGYKDGALKPRIPDPLQIPGFFPIPRPLQFTSRVDSLLPVPIYTFYKAQAMELNVITNRINVLIRALKVRGAYDGSAPELARILELDDGKLVPVENFNALLANGGKLENALFFLPITELVAALQQLYLQRDQIKSVIYEITGIADILRGSSVASETATAQNLKSQWGTLRLKRFQKEVARYARDCLRIMAAIAAKHFSQETFATMTELSFPSLQEKQQAAQLLQLGQSNPQLAQAVPPEAIARIQETASTPAWEEILQLLQSDLLRQYHIEVETNSTVDIEATEDKANIAEFLNALAQFLNGVAPVIEMGALPFDAAKAIMLELTRRFRFGSQVEKELEKMQAPKSPDGPDPKALESAQKEIESGKQELQKQAETVKAEQQKLKEQQMELDFSKKEALMELSFKQKEMQAQMKNAQQGLQLLHKGASMDQEHSARQNSLEDGYRKQELSRQQQLAQEKASAQESAMQQSKSELEPVLQSLAQLAQGLQAVTEQVSQLSASRDAPLEMVRGKDGKVASIRAGGKERPIKRDKSGKILSF